MTSRTALRAALHRAGYDLKRYPQCDPMWGLARLLRSLGTNIVFDIGANDGGFGRSIREHGYGERIVSFEPLSLPFSRLRHRTRRDANWTCHKMAIGASEGTVTVNIAGNDEASSSVLEMMPRHSAVAPTTRYIGKEEVLQCTLDSVVANAGLNEAQIPHFKIDVQGYEGEVLAGAEIALTGRNAASLQLELSLTPLYEGAMSWQDGFEFASANRFVPRKVLPGFMDPDTGESLQFDVVFVREAAS